MEFINRVLILNIIILWSQYKEENKEWSKEMGAKWLIDRWRQSLFVNKPKGGDWDERRRRITRVKSRKRGRHQQQQTHHYHFELNILLHTLTSLKTKIKPTHTALTCTHVTFRHGGISVECCRPICICVLETLY